MSNDKFNSHSLKTDSEQEEQGAQVLPFRRKLKSLNSTLERPKPSKFGKSRHSKVKTITPIRSKGLQALQAMLLATALLLTLKNCGII